MAPQLEKLRRAVRELRTVEMIYQGGSDPQPKSRMMDPYALVHRWGWWYVIGFCHLRNEMRSFRVDRIQQLLLTGQVFQMPPDFDIYSYLEKDVPGGPSGIKVRLLFAPQAQAAVQANRSNWEAVEDQADGSVMVTFFTPDINWAISTTLAYGPIVTALEPPELRQQVKEWAEAIVGKY